MDSLEVSEDTNKVGVVQMKTANAIKVKFSQVASGSEAMLLKIIRDSGKDAGFAPSRANYADALTRVQEVFERKNGNRKDFRDVLLFFTDATTGFVLDRNSARKINKLKVKPKYDKISLLAVNMIQKHRGKIASQWG